MSKILSELRKIEAGLERVADNYEKEVIRYRYFIVHSQGKYKDKIETGFQYKSDAEDHLAEVKEYDDGAKMYHMTKVGPQRLADFYESCGVKVGSSKSEIVKDVMGLSSGTLATLTGKKEYAYLDKLHQKFIQFVVGALDSDPKAYKNWKDAWKYFTESYDLDSLRVKQGCMKQGGMPNAAKVAIEDIKRLERSLHNLEEALNDEIEVAEMDAKAKYVGNYEDLTSLLESVDSVRIGIKGNIMSALKRLERASWRVQVRRDSEQFAIERMTNIKS